MCTSLRNRIAGRGTHLEAGAAPVGLDHYDMHKYTPNVVVANIGKGGKEACSGCGKIAISSRSELSGQEVLRQSKFLCQSYGPYIDPKNKEGEAAKGKIFGRLAGMAGGRV